MDWFLTATAGDERSDHLKEDSGDGEFGIRENHFSSPEVGISSEVPERKNRIML